jgi:Tfp pilus assembly protein PilP
MKLITSILTAAVMTGAVWAQNPIIINNVQDKLNGVQQQKTADSNAALGITGSPAAKQGTKPAAGSPPPAVKPAPIPGAKPVAATEPASPMAAKPVARPKSAASVSSANRLEKVNVVRHTDDIQIEISPREAVTPRVSKLSSPARVVVELPATAIATAQNKIAVASAGVKGVRIGMDGKTPPTTSVVVDLEQAYSYDIAPGAGNQLILTLHTQAVAKSTPAPVPAKISASAPKTQTASAKPIVTAPLTAPKAAKAAVVPNQSGPKVATVATPSAPKAGVATVTSKPVAKAAVPATTKTAAPAATKIVAEKQSPAIKAIEPPKPPKPEEKKKWAMHGGRDPFLSPVVQQSGGSGCSTGKKCLEIGQINLRGVVKAEAGFIAVVTNSLNKAYFLHENDPVFNGYVVRITGDSVIFSETVQDKLGKPLTREVTKRLTTPAV